MALLLKKIHSSSMDMYLCDLKHFVVAYCVLWCFIVFCGGLCCVLWCFVVFCGGLWCVLWCFVVFCGGLWCFVVVCGVLWWFVVFSVTPYGVYRIMPL